MTETTSKTPLPGWAVIAACVLAGLLGWQLTTSVVSGKSPTAFRADPEMLTPDR